MTDAEMKGQAGNQTKIKYHFCDWCSLGAVAGLAGGIFTALLGSVLTGLSWLDGAGSHLEKILGTVLLIMTIPLLILGAQCLDLLDRRKDRARDARFNEKK